MAMHAPAGGDDVELRDRLTIERLRNEVDGLPDLRVVDFNADWWDGQAHAPCLVVSFGRSGVRRRVVETGGSALVLPFSRRRAGRELAARRAPRRVEIGVPPPRLAIDDVVLDADGDAVRCGGGDCGAMRPVDAAGPCPLCGTCSSA
jgi:hypothetical protein